MSYTDAHLVHSVDHLLIYSWYPSGGRDAPGDQSDRATGWVTRLRDTNPWVAEFDVPGLWVFDSLVAVLYHKGYIELCWNVDVDMARVQDAYIPSHDDDWWSVNLSVSLMDPVDEFARRVGDDILERFGVVSGGKLRPAPRIDYQEYIQSAGWRKRSREARDRAGNRCQICNRAAGEVTLNAHHRTYARLGFELPEDLTVLCADCHQLYERARRLGKIKSDRSAP